MVQVSLGEIIKTDIVDTRSYKADRAYRCINSKRVDMVVIDYYGIPAAIVEYNGGGHHGDDPERTRKRGRVKAIAAEKAGIKLVELLPEMDGRKKRQLLFDAFMEYQTKKERPFVDSEGSASRPTGGHKGLRPSMTGSPGGESEASVAGHNQALATGSASRLR